MYVVAQHVKPQHDEQHRKKLAHGKLYAEHRVKQEDSAEHQQRHTPREGIAVEPPRNNIFLRVRRKTRAQQLRCATRINRRKEKRAEEAQNEERHAVRDDRHLKETGEDREMNDGFRCLAVIGRAQSRNKRQ